MCLCPCRKISFVTDRNEANHTSLCICTHFPFSHLIQRTKLLATNIQTFKIHVTDFSSFYSLRQCIIVGDKPVSRRHSLMTLSRHLKTPSAALFRTENRIQNRIFPLTGSKQAISCDVDLLPRKITLTCPSVYTHFHLIIHSFIHSQAFQKVSKKRKSPILLTLILPYKMCVI